jgi:uncharacterized protein
MNDKQNTALIQSVYEAFRRGDVPFIMSHVSSDSVWTTEGPAVIPYTGTKRGTKEVIGFFETLGNTLSDTKLTIDQFVEQGDAVATFGRFAATVKATGKKFDAPIGHYFVISNGKITRFIDIVETASVAQAYSANSAAAR